VIREIVNEMRDEAEGGESNNVSFSWGDKFMRIVCIFDTFLCTEIEQPTTLLLLYTVSLSLSLPSERMQTNEDDDDAHLSVHFLHELDRM
jgi:hypothetical protein